MALTFATIRFFAVIRQTMKAPLLLRCPQKWVKPKNVKVSGFPMPHRRVLSTRAVTPPEELGSGSTIGGKHYLGFTNPLQKLNRRFIILRCHNHEILPNNDLVSSTVMSFPEEFSPRMMGQLRRYWQADAQRARRMPLTSSDHAAFWSPAIYCLLIDWESFIQFQIELQDINSRFSEYPKLPAFCVFG